MDTKSHGSSIYLSKHCDRRFATYASCGLISDWLAAIPLFPGRAQARPAFANIAILVAISLTCAGCKTPPTNPFLARDANRPSAQDELADADKTTDPSEPAQTPDLKEAFSDLRDEFTAAAHDTGARVKQAAAQTAVQARQNGEQVAAQTADTATGLIRDTNAQVQKQAVDSLAALPIEQAGPALLLAIAEGGDVARRAAAQQLAERWPPAAGFPVESAAQSRAAAVAELQNLWAQQYGQVRQAVETTRAETEQLVVTTRDAMGQLQQSAAAIRQANLPESARREAIATLERLAVAADAEVRLRTAEAMGQLAEPVLVPTLMTMLNDSIDVQNAAMASLAQIAGSDVSQPGGAPTSHEERVRRWQLWYGERQASQPK